MSGPILSRDEINALLNANNSESLNEGFLNILKSVAEYMATWFGKFTGKTVDVEGPYVERIGESLTQSVSEESYMMIADLGSNQVYALMGLSDAELLGSKLGSEAQEAVQSLGEIWLGKLAQMLGTEYELYKAEKVETQMLSQFPIEEQPVLVRHLIDGLEFCFIIKTVDVLNFEKQKADMGPFTGAFSPEESISYPKRGKLLKGGKSPVSEAQFSPLELSGLAPTSHSINLLDDIDLLVTVELGQARLTLNEILELKPKSVISLNSHAGAPADIYINENLAAKGEVVVLDENFGVRILEIVPKSERIRGK
ncbi:MAG: FliM/FliN family flagellar motor switch protein [Bacillota bacterium]|nr:FliM/FliN family flagellar motor switch protein [Bacillota bacterium]